MMLYVFVKFTAILIFQRRQQLHFAEATVPVEPGDHLNDTSHSAGGTWSLQ